MDIEIGAYGVLLICLTFFSMIMLSNGVADLHYRTYGSKKPLYFIYGFIFVMIWFFGWMIIIYQINIHK